MRIEIIFSFYRELPIKFLPKTNEVSVKYVETHMYFSLISFRNYTFVNPNAKTIDTEEENVQTTETFSSRTVRNRRESP